MSEKKNIDRLFQEKFKDFEATPPEFVWDNLEEILQEKKKRRVIPLWWRVGGIAAALVVGMLFLYPFFTGIQDDNDPGTGVVYENQKQPNTGTTNPDAALPRDGQLQPNRSVKSQGPAANQNAVATAPNKVVDSENAKSQNAGGKFQKTNSKLQTSEGREEYANSGKGTGKNAKQGNKNNNLKPATQNTQQEYAGNRNPESGKQNGKNGNNNAFTPQPELATVNNSQKTNAQGGQKPDTTQQVAQSNGREGNNANRQPGLQEAQQQGVVQNENQAAQPVTNPQLPTTPEQPLADLQPSTENTNDSLQEPENELEKLQRKLQEEKEGLADNTKPGDTNKWNVKPQMGPLLYSSLSNGSPIDGQFANSSKSFDNQMSYGVGVNYAVSNKLRIRSGINTVNLSYATQDIQFYASLNQGTNNVARTSAANIVVENSGNRPIIPTNSLANSDALPKETFNGSMVQSTGYIEVPVEMEYALLNKKFGINVIGGFSTLFLNDNIVSVVSDQGLSTNVGEAQNLNNVSFSTNLGIGFKYRFFKQFEASFEPTFKYQVNTYTRDSGNFRPYFIGLYTGISFSF